MIPALLAILAILYLAFSGFGAAAGRNARIFKRAYYARAMLLGAGVGACLVAVQSFVTFVLYSHSEHPDAFFTELLLVGASMLWVFGVYTLLVFLALAIYAIGRAELRTLATVTILGPFTLLRPWVVVCGTAFGVSAPVSLRARALAVMSSGLLLLLGKTLDHGYGRKFRDSLFEISP